MRKTLLATTALACAGALAAAPASAADKLSVGVGGYMQQWFGYVDRDDNNSEGGVDTQADSEVYFQGSMESDAGLKFGVHVQLEANAPTGIDESFAHIGGAFGRLEIGARDSIQARTHYGISDVGVGLNAGDTQKWIGGAYLDTNGWLGDNLNLIYISPRVSGVQVGLSYGPDAGNENSVTSPPDGNDDAVWAAGINFDQAVGDASFKVSLGHRNRSQSDHDDDDTFTNVGVQVGFGAFQLNAAYAERDKGTDMAADQWDVWGASVKYTDGPMALSLGHMAHDTDASTERTATMFSASYTLAPGVAWRSSAFAVEDDTDASAAKNEGTSFVTGITLNF